MTTLNNVIDSFFSTVISTLPDYRNVPSSKKLTYQKLESRNKINIVKDENGYYREMNTNYLFGQMRDCFYVIAKQDVKSSLGFNELETQDLAKCQDLGFEYIRYKFNFIEGEKNIKVEKYARESNFEIESIHQEDKILIEHYLLVKII